MEKILVYFAIKYGGDWDKIYKAINMKEKIDSNEVEKVVSNHGEKYLTLLNDDYPDKLKNIYKPPFVLFYRGDISLVKEKAMAVIGSRKNSQYGKKITEELTTQLVEKKYSIVSGLAEGIDSIAHRTCLNNKGKTIAVLGNGLNVIYPESNKELQKEIELNGLVISEYPNNVKSNKENFPIRNRIVAGLSDAIVVSEAKRKSGTMITVARALEMGKEIFCVPYKIGEDSGCNTLIKEGAKLIETVDDILNEL